MEFQLGPSWWPRVVYKYNSWGCNVSQAISGSKVHRLRINQSPWLSACLGNSLHIKHNYSPWREDVPRTISRSKGKDQGLSFRGVHSVATFLFDRFDSYGVQIQCMRRQYVSQVKRSKFKVTWVFHIKYDVPQLVDALSFLYVLICIICIVIY